MMVIIVQVFIIGHNSQYQGSFVINLHYQTIFCNINILIGATIKVFFFFYLKKAKLLLTHHNAILEVGNFSSNSTWFQITQSSYP